MTAEVRWGARAGLAARALVYLLLGVIALALAIRGAGRTGTKELDQKGAVSELAAQPFGVALVIALAIGLAAYSLWQLSQVATGVSGERDSAAKRVRCLVSGLVYAGLAATSVSIVIGSRGAHRSQGSEQAGLTARVMRHEGGRPLIFVIGLAVLVTGLVLLGSGLLTTFMERMSVPSPQIETMVRRLGQVGTVARGVVVALAGVLIIDAAWTYRPQKARGVDGALRTLLQQPYGRWLTAVAALGLIAFGLFGLAETRYRKT